MIFFGGDFDLKIYKELEEKKFHIILSDTKNCLKHGHEFLEFTYVLEGEMEHMIGGGCSRVGAGDYFIVDYGTEHSYRQVGHEPLLVINLLFYPEFAERTLAGCRSFEDVLNSYLLRFSYKSLRSSPTGVAFHDESGTIRDIIDRVRHEYDKKRHGYIEYIRCLFMEILILTMRKIGKDEKKAKQSEAVTEMTEYIRLNYKEKLKLSELAKRYNYSLSYISKKFKDETGVGFSEYLQRIRIEQSCRLLENSDLRISEVAARVGYDNVKFFNKVFKETLDLTPREFRKLQT